MSSSPQSRAAGWTTCARLLPGIFSSDSAPAPSKRARGEYAQRRVVVHHSGGSRLPSIGTYVRAAIIAPVALGSLFMRPVLAVDMAGAGASHACLLKNGAVYCWGTSTNGKLGDPSAAATLTPRLVPDLDGSTPAKTATYVDAGKDHTCALLSDGSVKCWGYNGDSDRCYLGSGCSATFHATPQVVIGIDGTSASTTATQLSVDGACNIALMSDGSVKCWGLNNKGQLANATHTAMGSGSYGAMTVSGLGSTAVSEVKVGSESACVVFVDGTVKCWGSNADKRLGDGSADTTARRYSPVSVVGINGLTDATTATSVEIGGNGHSCALMVDRSVKCWGNNYNGQVTGVAGGNADITTRPGIDGSDASQKALQMQELASTTHFVMMDGSFKSVGQGDTGLLGVGTNTNSPSLVTATGIDGTSPSTTAVRVKASYGTTYVEMADGTWKCAGYNSGNGLCGTGATDNYLYVYTNVGIPTSPCDASAAITNADDLNDCTSTLAHGASCTPRCNTGYTLTGTRSCNDGSLTDTAACVGNSCDASAAITNADDLNDCTSTLASGASCTPRCNTGYTLTGTRSCSAGSLTDTASCLQKCDASAAITNADDLNDCTSTLAHGASCTPRCNTGYTLTGTRSCNDGSLTDTAACVGNSCDASAAITNADDLNDCTSTLASGASCTPRCNTGYTLTGTRSCSAGSLTDTATCAANPSSPDGSPSPAPPDGASPSSSPDSSLVVYDDSSGGSSASNGKQSNVLVAILGGTLGMCVIFILLFVGPCPLQLSGDATEKYRGDEESPP